MSQMLMILLHNVTINTRTLVSEKLMSCRNCQQQYVSSQPVQLRGVRDGREPSDPAALLDELLLHGAAAGGAPGQQVVPPQPARARPHPGGRAGAPRAVRAPLRRLLRALRPLAADWLAAAAAPPPGRQAPPRPLALPPSPNTPPLRHHERSALQTRLRSLYAICLIFDTSDRIWA